VEKTAGCGRIARELNDTPGLTLWARYAVGTPLADEYQTTVNYEVKNNLK
jgi:hypothetical protein